jgi:ketosteroid isomerase-like protein
MQRQVVDAFLAGDAVAVTDLLGPDASFHSPVTDYHGPERVREVLTALAQVLKDPAPSTVLEAPDVAVAFFTAELEDRRAEGVLRVAGSDVTLMIRPLKSLLAGIERMKQLL